MLHKYERLLEMLTIKFWNKFVHHGDTDCFGGTIVQSMRGYFERRRTDLTKREKKELDITPKKLYKG